jgi:hypothetical protein
MIAVTAGDGVAMSKEELWYHWKLCHFMREETTRAGKNHFPWQYRLLLGHGMWRGMVTEESAIQVSIEPKSGRRPTTECPN